MRETTTPPVLVPQVIAGTGHRPDKLGGYDAAIAQRLIALARAALMKYQPDEVISGMALGWDTALALAAIDLGVPLTAAVPFDGQESRWRMEQQRQFHAILERATSVVIVKPGGYAVWKMQARNEWMVDRATKLLSLWNGSAGGTANCVEYAIARGVPIANLWSTWSKYAFAPAAMPETDDEGAAAPGNRC